MSVTQTIYARHTVSMTDLRRNPSEVIEVANLAPVAVLNHNKPAAYLISAAAYEEILEQIEDATLTKIVKARQGGRSVKVNIDDL
jgi:antitoxin StbD